MAPAVSAVEATSSYLSVCYVVVTSKLKTTQDSEAYRCNVFQRLAKTLKDKEHRGPNMFSLLFDIAGNRHQKVWAGSERCDPMETQLLRV